jgi:putative addiction module antidote
MHKLTIRKIGNSYGVILPKEALDELNAKAGDVLMLVRDKDAFRLAPLNEEFEAAMAAYEEGRIAYRDTLRALAK